LGTSGLIQAYKQVASFVLQSTPLLRKQIELQYKIECDYLKIDEVLRILQSNGCTVHEKKVELFCQINAMVPAYRSEEITNIIKTIPGVTVNLL
jgi:putative IMPACT (imprinted ancient) family translation regulator